MTERHSYPSTPAGTGSGIPDTTYGDDHPTDTLATGEVWAGYPPEEIDEFGRLYPDVDPRRDRPITWPECLAIAVSAAVMAYGAVTMNLVVLGIGLALLLFAAIAPGQVTARRIRREARDRFPYEPWAESEITHARRARVMVPVIWSINLVVCLLLWWLVPAEHSVIAALIAAVCVFISICLAPGLSPVWRASR
ncbi:hypothetical protein ACFSSC_02140 [Corynebacterium mendelii]|uniref:Uncharacterized protein n=1 Tax=Corynebacterium mendelii TaxID=2765362 RepID=A0A939E226_9CORY|nr:hypothetical protein [Corynebacterium mendelii]MBN9644082.1 hypothetical protein [Corynebacterium mendelii]